MPKMDLTSETRMPHNRLFIQFVILLRVDELHQGIITPI